MAQLPIVSKALVAGLVLALPIPLYIVFSLKYFGGSDGLVDPTGHFVGRDFINLWMASDLLGRGEVERIFDVESFHVEQSEVLGQDFPLHLWSYPPHFLYFVVPLALMPYLAAYGFWTVVGLAALLAAATPLFRRPGLAGLSLALAPSTFVNFVAGQSGTLIAALLVAGLRLSGSRPIVSGTLFGLLTVKPQLGLVVPVVLIATRNWAAIASAAAVGGLVILSSGLIFGWDVWISYLNANFETTSSLLEAGSGNFQLMMPTAFMSVRILYDNLAFAYLVQAVVTMVSLIIVYRTWRSSRSLERKLGITLLGAIVSTPYAHNYDLSIASVAILLFFQNKLDERSRFTGHIMMLVWFLPIIVLPFNWVGWPIGPLLLLGLAWSAYWATEESDGLTSISTSSPREASVLSADARCGPLGTKHSRNGT